VYLQAKANAVPTIGLKELSAVQQQQPLLSPFMRKELWMHMLVLCSCLVLAGKGQRCSRHRIEGAASTTAAAFAGAGQY
jgi:hypothetical protein